MAKKRYSKPSPDNKPVIAHTLIFLAIVVVIAIFALRPFLVGLTTVGEEKLFTQDLNLEVSESTEYDWVLAELPEQSQLTSVRVSGSLAGPGAAKVWLQTENGDKLLVFDSKQLEQASSGVTGLSTEDGSEAPSEPSETPSESPSEAPPEQAPEETQPVEAPPVEEQPAEQPTEQPAEQPAEQPVEVPPAPPEEQPAPAPPPEEQPPVEQPPEEVPTGEPSPEQTPEQIQEQSFEYSCAETCHVPAGPVQTSYNLIIEVDEGTTLKLDSIEYTLLLPAAPLVENITNETIPIITNETVFFETTIIDANNEVVPAVIEFIDSETKELEAKGKSEKGDPEITEAELEDKRAKSEEQPVEEQPIEETTPLQGAAVAEEPAIEEAPGEPGIEIPKDTYDVKVTLQNNPIQEIVFEDVDATQDVTEFVKIDDPPENGSKFIEIYAIDPTGFNFTTATVTGIAKGEALYKCKDWDFANQTCLGSWTKVIDLTPGEPYTFTLTPEDPAFGDLRVQTCVAEDVAAKGTFPDACDGVYPSACGVAGDLLSCDDGLVETHDMDATAPGNYAGLKLTIFNSSVTDCTVITNVTVCFEWWTVAAAGPTDCDISVDNQNGTNFTAINTTCPIQGTANPGMVCQDVTSVKNWTCGNFFGPDTGQFRAMIKSELVRGQGEADKTVSWDGLGFFNTSYAAVVNDTTAPVVTIIAPSPANNSYTASTTATINASVTDSQSNIDTCRLRFDGVNSTMTKNGAGLSVTCNSTQSGLSQGLHNYTVFANDTFNNTGVNGTFFFTVDTVFPQVQFVSPTETSGSFLTRNNVVTNTTATDTNLANITTRLFNTTGLVNSTTSTTSPLFLNFTSRPDGQYFFNSTATDLAGNQNSTETRNVTIDTLNPQIQFVAPTKANNSFVTGIQVVNVTASDANLVNVTIFMNGTLVQTCTSPASPCNFTWNTTQFAEGSIQRFNSTATDRSGRTNSTETRTYTVDNLAPNITFVAPTPANNSIQSSTSATINATVVDATSNVDICTLRFDGVNESMTKVGAGSSVTCNTTKTGLSQGLHNFTVFANDTADPTGVSETRFFTVDTGAPQIQFVSPTETSGTFLTRNNILTNVTATDANLANITIRLFNSTGLVNSTTSASSPLFLNFTNLPDGVYFFNATALDMAGNSNSTETRNVTIDTTKPQIQYVAPTETSGTYLNRNNILTNVTATDTNFANVTTRLFNTTGLVNATTSTTSPLFLNFTSLSDGVYLFNSTAIDLAGNSNSTETRNVTIDTTKPQVQFVAPTPANGSVINGTQVINVTATDTNLANITIFIDGSLMQTCGSSPCNFTWDTTTYLNGLHTFNATATDLASNQNSTETRTVNVSNAGVNVVFIAPTPPSGTVTSNTTAVINASVSSSSAIDTCTLTFDGANETMTKVGAGTSVTCNATKTSLTEGTHTYNATANDTLGTSGTSATRTLIIDLTNPLVQFVAPTPANNSNVTGTKPINVTATDANLANITIFMNGTLVLTCASSPCTYNFDTTLFAEGSQHNFNATARDLASNQNSTETRTYIVDNSAPNITFVSPSPANNSFVTSTTATINATVTDATSSIDTCTLNFDGVNESMTKIGAGTSVTCNTTKTGLSQGLHNFTVFANDTADPTGVSETRFFTVDTLSPQIQFVAPTETSGSVINRDNIQVNVTATDANLANITIFLFNSTGLVNSTNSTTSPFFLNFTGLADGTYFFNATTIDGAGNTNNTETRNVTIDTVNPSVTVVAPTAGSEFNTTQTIEIAANVTDNLAVDTVLANITLPNGTIQQLVLVLDGGSKYNASFTIPNLVGQYNVTFIANDTAGNVNDTEKTNFTARGLSAVILTTDQTTYRQGTSAQTGDNMGFGIKYFINFTARYFDSVAGFGTPITDGNCTVVSNTTARTAPLTFNATTGNYTGSLDTFKEFDNTTYVVDCSSPTYHNATNSTTANVYWFNFMIETNGSISFGGSGNDLQNATTWLSKVEPNSTTILSQGFDVTLQPNETDGHVAEIFFCGSNTLQTCSFLKNFDMEGNITLRANLSASANDVCQPKLCYHHLDFNLETKFEACGEPTSSLTTTPTVVEQIAPLDGTSIDSGDFISLHVHCDADPDLSSETNVTVTAYYNYTGEPASIEIHHPEPFELIMEDIDFRQIEPSYLIGPGQRLNVTLNETESLNNTQSIARAFNVFHVPETFAEFKPNIIPSTNIVFNSTGQIWASDNASLGAPNNVTLLNSDVQLYATETIPANSVVNETIQMKHRDAIRDNETLTQNISGNLRWTVFVRTIFTSEVTIYNVTVFTNYSTYGAQDNFAFFVNLTNSSGTFDISSEVVKNTTADTLTFPAQSLSEINFTVLALDVTAPSITLVAPTPANNTVTKNTTVIINATATNGVGIDTCTLELDSVNSTMTKIGSGSSVTCNSTITGLSDGTHTFRVYANDTVGNLNASETRVFTVDTTSPQIQYVSPTPANGTTLAADNFDINATATDSIALGTCTLNFDGVNESMIETGNATSRVCRKEKSALSDGVYNFTVFVNDSAGNINSTETRFVTIDTLEPVITFVAPTPADNGTIIGNNFTVNVTAINAISPIDTCILTVSNSTFSIDLVMTKIGGISAVCNATTPDLAFGTYNYSVFANDTAGLGTTTANRTVTLEPADTTPPVITLIGPINGTSDTDGSVTFEYNVTDAASGVDSCELIINNVTDQTDTSVTEGITQSFTKTGLSNGNYTWSINCTDDSPAANEGSSETREFGVSIPKVGERVKGPSAPVYVPPTPPIPPVTPPVTPPAPTPSPTVAPFALNAVTFALMLIALLILLRLFPPIGREKHKHIIDLIRPI